MRVAFLLCLFAIFASAYDIHDARRDIVTLRDSINQVQRVLNQGKAALKSAGASAVSVECALCGIVVNELEGFLAENISEQEIIQTIDSRICTYLSGDLSARCDELVSYIPELIEKVEARESVSVICVNYNFCSIPFVVRPDPQPVPKFIVSLDEDPSVRWNEVCSTPLYQNRTQYLVNTVDSLLPGHGAMINDLGKFLLDYYFPTDLAAEIRGCGTALGIELGWAAWFNVGYEVSDACTSIVAQDAAGNILHARSLDFWAGMGFTDTLKDMTIQVEFQRSGKLQYYTTGFAGFVGALSGMKPNGFSVTINSRFYPGGVGELFYEVVAAIMERNATMVTFLSRDALNDPTTDFNSALKMLSNSELIADVYYIMAGVSAGQGAVISRNRFNATNVWMLDSPNRWFEVETNYDHWEKAPWFDDRRIPANNAMNKLNTNTVTLETMFEVLDVKPVMNIQTTYSILACPATGEYKSFIRNCKYPCTE